MSRQSVSSPADRILERVQNDPYALIESVNRSSKMSGKSAGEDIAAALPSVPHVPQIAVPGIPTVQPDETDIITGKWRKPKSALGLVYNNIYSH